MVQVGCGNGQLLCCDGQHRSSESNDGKGNIHPLAQVQLGGQRQLTSNFGGSSLQGLVGNGNGHQLQQLQMQHALLQQQKERLLQMQNLQQLQTLQQGGYGQGGNLGVSGGGLGQAGLFGLQAQLRPQSIQQQLLLQQLQGQQLQGLGGQLRPLSGYQGQPQLSGLNSQLLALQGQGQFGGRPIGIHPSQLQSQYLAQGGQQLPYPGLGGAGFGIGGVPPQGLAGGIPLGAGAGFQGLGPGYQTGFQNGIGLGGGYPLGAGLGGPFGGGYPGQGFPPLSIAPGPFSRCLIFSLTFISFKSFLFYQKPVAENHDILMAFLLKGLNVSSSKRLIWCRTPCRDKIQKLNSQIQIL